MGLQKFTKEQHIERHKKLHEALDELLADYLRHHPNAYPSQITVIDLATWSRQQVTNPTEGAN